MPSTPDGFIGDACAESWNVVAQRGSVDSKNGVHIESDLMNPNNCTITDHQCIDNGHTVVWKLPDMHVFCSHELAGEFDALVSMSHVLLPPVQSAFVLKPHSTIPKSVQECIGGTVLAAGNDAFIKFLDALPANITSPWMTHNMTASQRSRRSTQAQLRTGFGGTERRPRDLHFPSTTEAKTLTATQQLEAVKLKFQALRAVLSLPPAQAFYNTNVNRLAYDLKQRRLERQRKQTKWRDAEKAKTPKTALQHNPTFITKAVTTTQTDLITEASLTTKATSITQQPPTTTAPTISATMTPETPRFPYTEPKIFLAKKATNGSTYFQGTNRKKYWDLKQMPHGSAVLEKDTDVVHHVFWPSTDADGIRLYRLSRFEHEEERRQGPRFRPTRHQRHEPEALLLNEVRMKDTLLPAEAQEIYDLWAGLEERNHFNDVLNDFLLEEAEYETYEEPKLEAEDGEPMPQAEGDHEEGPSPPEEAIQQEATREAAFTVQEDNAGRRKRSTKTSKEWDYGNDDERDKAASKRMKNRFNKDLNATASGEESEEEAGPEDPEDSDTDDNPEKDAEGMQLPSNASVEMNQMART
ncbi:hypothetical protein AAVH_43001, partial [Aphelenchoides avenae]